MKRVFIRPGKSTLVSEEALARARQGLEKFGATPEAMQKLASFTGDTTIGKPRATRGLKAVATRSLRSK